MFHLAVIIIAIALLPAAVCIMLTASALLFYGIIALVVLAVAAIFLVYMGKSAFQYPEAFTILLCYVIFNIYAWRHFRKVLGSDEGATRTLFLLNAFGIGMAGLFDGIFRSDWAIFPIGCILFLLFLIIMGYAVFKDWKTVSPLKSHPLSTHSNPWTTKSDGYRGWSFAATIAFGLPTLWVAGHPSAMRVDVSHNIPVATVRTNPTPPVNPAPPLRRLAVVDAIQLNMRSGPSVDYKVVWVLNQSEVVEILAQSDNEWNEVVVIDRDGISHRGYAHGAYLRPSR